MLFIAWFCLIIYILSSIVNLYKSIESRDNTFGIIVALILQILITICLLKLVVIL